MADLLIHGGTVVDGTGAPPYAADVVVRDGRILAIEPAYAGVARRSVDARGKIVAPGFIDIKTHSDWTLPVVPTADSKVGQGVTTEVIGHCGYSVAPALPGRVDLLRDYLAPSAPWLPFRETTFAEYLETFPRTSVNTIMLVGHNTLRLMTMGMDRRAPKPDELTSMQRLLDEALDAGALGLSSGLFTAPGSYAEAEEMVTLGRVLRRQGASYATHVRNEADRVFEAVDEALALAEACDLHVQIVHLKASGCDNWGQAQRLLAVIDAARRRGLEIDCDQYPYAAASNPLRNLLPLWVQDGGDAAMVDRLKAPATRARIRTDIAAHGLNSFGRIPSWDAVRIAISPRQPEDAGKTIAEIADDGSGDPIDAVCDCLIADRGATRIVIASMSEEDVREILRSPTVFVGSDGFALSPSGITGTGRPHPRIYGTFPRVLGHYTRDLGLLTLPTAIRKMTGGPAAALRLIHRGLIRENYWADLVVFDPTTIIDRATYDDPHQFPIGIETVVVNGVVVVDAGTHTGARPGNVLRRTSRGVG